MGVMCKGHQGILLRYLGFCVRQYTDLNKI